MVLSGLGVAFIGELGAAAVSDASVGKLLSGCTPTRIVTLTTQMLIDTHSSLLQAALVRLVDSFLGHATFIYCCSCQATVKEALHSEIEIKISLSGQHDDSPQHV